jgi:hypothetical protein
MSIQQGPTEPEEENAPPQRREEEEAQRYPAHEDPEQAVDPDQEKES